MTFVLQRVVHVDGRVGVFGVVDGDAVVVVDGQTVDHRPRFGVTRINGPILARLAFVLSYAASAITPALLQI